MSVSNAVRDLQNQTALQQTLDAQRARRESSEPGNNRNVSGMMGKNDFLLLLSAQLRHQDPLNPQSDGEFASQLAQFASLEQMQNMNDTLSMMSGFQAYSLIGKYVMAEAIVELDGRMQLAEIAGIVDSVFSRDGQMFAQVGMYVVPISSITEVFDSSVLLTSDSLLQASNNLIGRTIKAQIGDNVIEGVVTRVTVENGILFAQIDDGTDEPKFVPVGAIFDIRQPGTPAEGRPGQAGATDGDGDGEEGDDGSDDGGDDGVENP